jgi:multiple sugar transport system substrate-binding protein
MVPDQREALDEIIVKIRAGRITRRTFLERAIAIGLTSSVAGSLLEACGGGGGGSSGPLYLPG